MCRKIRSLIRKKKLKSQSWSLSRANFYKNHSVSENELRNILTCDKNQTAQDSKCLNPSVLPPAAHCDTVNQQEDARPSSPLIRRGYSIHEFCQSRKEWSTSYVIDGKVWKPTDKANDIQTEFTIANPVVKLTPFNSNVAHKLQDRRLGLQELETRTLEENCTLRTDTTCTTKLQSQRHRQFTNAGEMKFESMEFTVSETIVSKVSSPRESFNTSSNNDSNFSVSQELEIFTNKNTTDATVTTSAINSGLSEVRCLNKSAPVNKASGKTGRQNMASVETSMENARFISSNRTHLTNLEFSSNKSKVTRQKETKSSSISSRLSTHKNADKFRIFSSRGDLSRGKVCAKRVTLPNLDKSVYDFDASEASSPVSKCIPLIHPPKGHHRGKVSNKGARIQKCKYWRNHDTTGVCKSCMKKKNRVAVYEMSGKSTVEKLDGSAKYGRAITNCDIARHLSASENRFEERSPNDQDDRIVLSSTNSVAKTGMCDLNDRVDLNPFKMGESSSENGQYRLDSMEKCVCSWCGETYSNLQDLDRHSLSHAEESDVWTLKGVVGDEECSFHPHETNSSRGLDEGGTVKKSNNSDAPFASQHGSLKSDSVRKSQSLNQIDELPHQVLCSSSSDSTQTTDTFQTEVSASVSPQNECDSSQGESIVNLARNEKASSELNNLFPPVQETSSDDTILGGEMAGNQSQEVVSMQSVCVTQPNLATFTDAANILPLSLLPNLGKPSILPNDLSLAVHTEEVLQEPILTNKPAPILSSVTTVKDNLGVSAVVSSELTKSFESESDQAKYLLLQQVQEVFYKCAECGAVFRSLKRCEIHTAVSHSVFRLVCIECNRKFCSDELLQSHVTRNHRSVTINHCCRFCQLKYFSSQTNLINHIRLAHPKFRPYSCVCGESFDLLPQLKHHVVSHTQILCQLHCTVCFSWFPTKDLLHAHTFNEHNSQYHYPCVLCERGFSSLAGLSSHTGAVHAKIKPYSCQTCPVSFQSPVKFIHHYMEKHAFDRGEVWHKCSECELVSLDMLHITEHEETDHMKILSLERIVQLFSLMSDVTT